MAKRGDRPDPTQPAPLDDAVPAERDDGARDPSAADDAPGDGDGERAVNETERRYGIDENPG
jgi:hypothetical protein